MAFLLTLEKHQKKSVPAHLRERALGMLQGGMKTTDVARAINCNVRTVRRLRPRVEHLHRIGTSEHHTCGTGTGWQQQLRHTLNAQSLHQCLACPQ